MQFANLEGTLHKVVAKKSPYQLMHMQPEAVRTINSRGLCDSELRRGRHQNAILCRESSRVLETTGSKDDQNVLFSNAAELQTHVLNESAQCHGADEFRPGQRRLSALRRHRYERRANIETLTGSRRRHFTYGTQAPFLRPNMGSPLIVPQVSPQVFLTGQRRASRKAVIVEGLLRSRYHSSL